MSQEETVVLRSALLEWYDVHQRVLPWRKPSEKFVETSEEGKRRQEEWEEKEWDHAYGVLVSELMLQQTQYVGRSREEEGKEGGGLFTVLRG